MTDKLFPSGYPSVVSVADGDTLFLDAGGVPSGIDIADLAESLDLRRGEPVNVRKYGAGTGDATADTIAIKAAWVAGQAFGGAPHLYFPPGTYYFQDDTLALLTPGARISGKNASVVFKGTGQWKLGDNVTSGGTVEFEGIIFYIDSTSSVQAPVSIYNAGRVTFRNCTWTNIKTSAIDLRLGVLVMRGCDSTMVASGGSSVVYAAIPTGLSAAIFIVGGRFNSSDHAAKYLVDHSGAGEIDGLVLFKVNTASLDGVIKSASASGGHLSNCMAFGCLFDQVDQTAFSFAPGAGSTLNDVSIVGNKINSWSMSSATSGAFVSLDMSSGATHGAFPFIVADNVMASARRRAVEVLGGTHGRVVISRNSIAEYGSSANVASRGIYIKGTFDYLEVADNDLSTSYAHNYGIEFDTVTATQSKEQGNTFAGTAAALGNRSTRSFQSLRPMLSAALTIYVRTDGSDSNCGLVNSAAGAFLTLQKAWDTAAGFDLNGQTITIQVADGTYTAGITAAKSPVGLGAINIVGNTSTPTNVILSVTSADCFKNTAPIQATVTLRAMQLQTTTSGYCVRASAPIRLSLNALTYGSCAGIHICAEAQGAVITAISNYTITGGATYHAQADVGGQVLLDNRTVTLTGTPAFTAFALAGRGGLLGARSMTFSGSATGNRYSAVTGGIIDTNGGGATYLPGGSSGSATVPGYYL